MQNVCTCFIKTSLYLLVFFIEVQYINIPIDISQSDEYLTHIHIHAIIKFKFCKKMLDRYKMFGPLIRIFIFYLDSINSSI